MHRDFAPSSWSASRTGSTSPGKPGNSERCGVKEYYLRFMPRLAFVLLLLTHACTTPRDRAPSAACGLAALAGPTALLAQFGIPDQTLASPPRNLPERLVVRQVAGQAYPAIVGRADSLWIIGLQ